MFKKNPDWLGLVEMKVEGDELEAFINRCVENNITLSDIRRTSSGKMLQATIRIADVKSLRKITKHMNVSVRFGRRRGLYVFTRQGRRRFGFMLGIFAFCIVLFLLSQMVWRVDIEGASPGIEHEIEEWAADIGLQPGQPQWPLPPEAELQQRVSEEVPGATWIGVERRGTAYQFHVVEQQLAEEEEEIAPRDLVARKNGVIRDIYVEHGRGEVTRNAYVEEGDLLITGRIGCEGQEEDEDEEDGVADEEVAAIGEVRAETWYRGSIELPFEISGEVLTGERTRSFELQLFGNEWTFWGQNAEHLYDRYEAETNEVNIPLYFTDIPLPIERTSYEEKVAVTRSYEEDELIEIGKSLGERELLRTLDSDAAVLSENILQQQSDNGTVRLSILYEVEEDIAEEAPIRQGD
ncbi:sporulation protein YqfD [Natribacillus halophilus]|uniref:Similar to stage IV sporulation protein n=1 Tax=Natribacillus halophilus TaxID=549003 RepID=A0A1G8JSF3_9BACI|nr:sporulation protein YqfD [Natribacillus halophilus]SDI34138.1 similar to stage IV sporulation protein [Natribacillus halophilus]